MTYDEILAVAEQQVASATAPARTTSIAAPLASPKMPATSGGGKPTSAPPSTAPLLSEYLTREAFGKISGQDFCRICRDEFRRSAELRTKFGTEAAYIGHATRACLAREEPDVKLTPAVRSTLLAMGPRQIVSHCAAEFKASPILQATFRTEEAYSSWLIGQLVRR